MRRKLRWEELDAHMAQTRAMAIRALKDLAEIAPVFVEATMAEMGFDMNGEEIRGSSSEDSEGRHPAAQSESQDQKTAN